MVCQTEGVHVSRGVDNLLFFAYWVVHIVLVQKLKMHVVNAEKFRSGQALNLKA